MTFSTGAQAGIEKKLQNRPDKAQLVDQGILKTPALDGSLQAHAADLQKAQLEDTLEKKLADRPSLEDLTQKHILAADPSKIAPALQQPMADLAKAQVQNALDRELKMRPDAKSLEGLNILKDQSVAPSLQQARAELAKAQLEDSLEKKIQARPDAEDAAVKKFTSN